MAKSGRRLTIRELPAAVAAGNVLRSMVGAGTRQREQVRSAGPREGGAEARELGCVRGKEEAAACWGFGWRGNHGSWSEAAVGRGWI